MTEDEVQKVVALNREIQRLQLLVRNMDSGWKYLGRPSTGIYSYTYEPLDDFLLDAIREAAGKRIAELKNELAQL